MQGILKVFFFFFKWAFMCVFFFFFFLDNFNLKNKAISNLIYNLIVWGQYSHTYP